MLTAGAKTGAPELTKAELAELVETATRAGVPTAAHAHGAEGIVNASEAGITSVEHSTYIDREAAAVLAKNDTRWVPTASALRGIVDNPDAGIPFNTFDDVGLIEAGYAADLVVLDANPREDPAAYEDSAAVTADGTRVV